MESNKILNVGKFVYFESVKKAAVITAIHRSLGKGTYAAIPENTRYYDVAGKLIYGVDLITPDDKQVFTCVHVSNIEIQAADIFKCGDKVQSIFNGFYGVVTSFEMETNRVICRPAKSKRDRIRYAYKSYELVSLDKVKINIVLDSLEANHVYQFKYMYSSGQKCTAIVRIIEYQGEAYLLDNNTGHLGASMKEFKKECTLLSITDSNGKKLY